MGNLREDGQGGGPGEGVAHFEPQPVSTACYFCCFSLRQRSFAVSVYVYVSMLRFSLDSLDSDHDDDHDAGYVFPLDHDDDLDAGYHDDGDHDVCCCC